MLKRHSVLGISLSLSILFVVIGVVFNDWLGQKASAFLDFAVTYFNWFYLLVGTIFVMLCLYLMFSKYGNIRLGKDEDKPDYNTISWISMLFSAGMGVGLVFWSIAEPVTHYITPAYGEGSTSQSAELSMVYTFFHWGVHPWAIFSTIGLGLAYFQFRKGLPATVSSIFYPILGDNIKGPIGKVIDILAVFVTAVGVASTFGLSALQISSGLHTEWGVPNSLSIQLLIIIIATVLFLLSATTGLDRGIKYLSNTNMLIFFILMLIVLIVGPTRQIFEVLISSTGSYLTKIVPFSFRLAPYNAGQDKWISDWTVFYWAWWMTWAPFVGSFIARISKGRTIKEFMMGVLIVPTLLTFVWFSILGGTALHLVNDLHNSGLAKSITNDMTSALFLFFNNIPMGSILSILAMFLIFTFFITSADSAVFVLGILSMKGDLNPSKKIKMIWGIIVAGAAVVFLVAGGLEAVKTISIVIASPFTIIMLFICYSLFKAIRSDYLQQPLRINVRKEKNRTKENIAETKKAEQI
ncbi:glycine betaine transporter [Scopulibacillus darangshiensis]|uniref:Glycine betaine transporter n=1 Tax=Scopulibacillus darangshiensis TaxID=442528 RepID=A0A4R2NM48_9BACL|nr:BCCT family transporter [Scopulibacillus darangshiensis]TCP22670.1 glycine betaine transporter [Scopulibacillus darangshiensis]